MSEIVSTEHAKAVTTTTAAAAANVSAASHAARRAVVFAEPGASKFLEQMLARDGYTVEPTESLERALQLSEQLAPDVLLIEVQRETSAGFTLVRRVRAQAATYALPVVLIFRDDSATLRKAALRAGVDDYFAVTTPPNELRARLDALFWRVEAGRRQALAPGDQHGEIDNFMSLLDRMRADVHEGLHGVLALMEATARTTNTDESDKKAAEKFDRATRDRTLRDAHGFLKLNLRRRDSVAFYGPTMLLIYLPQRTEADARRVLTELRNEFLSFTSDGDIAVGLSSFAFSDEETDTSTTSIENLIERAELAVAHARARDHVSRIFDGDMSRRAASATRADNAPTTQTNVAPAPPAIAEMNEPLQTDAPRPSVTPSPTRAVATTIASPPSANAPLHSAASRNMAQAHHGDASGAPSSSPQLSPPQARHPSASSTSTPSHHTPRARQTVVRETRRADATTGDLSLPTSDEASSQATRHAIERELERRARGEVMPRRLLLTVSDAARMAQLNLLVRSAGYEARAAFDGQQALDLLRIERPDLLLLDYALQGMDGVETIRRLRKQLGGTLTLPVVLLLREEETQARQEAVALGVRGVVLTPYDPAALLDSVRTVGKRE